MIIITTDKTHPAAPNLDGFNCGPLKPGYQQQQQQQQQQQTIITKITSKQQ